jgi:C-terminal processing protease CtpA/Prc
MKKKWILLFSIFSTYAVCFAQTNRLNNQQVQSLTALGHLWGFLKYYHPQVAKGAWDWDSVLLQKIPLYREAKNKEAVSKLTSEWIKELGPVNPCKNCYKNVPDSLAYNLDFSWMSEKTFTTEVASRLNFIRDNRNFGKHYYAEYINKNLVRFAHEKFYNEPKYLFPDANTRLLVLFRYWNIVNYFSPYKYLSDKNWNTVLQEKVPAFFNAKDTLAYQLEFVKLVNELGDGHSIFYSNPVLENFFGHLYQTPFTCMLIDNQFVVNFISNDSAAAALGIRKGDIIKEVNGEDAVKKYSRLIPYVIASNEDARAQIFAKHFLFRSKDSVFIIKKLRSGKAFLDTIQLSSKQIPFNLPAKHWKIISDSIGYVNMDALQKNEVDSMMKELFFTKGLIIDLRAYPHNTWDLIAGYLSEKPFVMSRISYADLDYPGVFLYQKTTWYGKENRSPYKGKVILLVDESTVSHAEYSAMGLQAATHTITIGNTTAGQDGDITERFWMPGALFSRFSGKGVYYPDGTITQRKGVRIDIKMRPTVKGLQEGRDEILETAINYIWLNK